MKNKDILSIEILYDDKEELDELLESKDFHYLLLNEAYKVIEEAIKEDEVEVKLAYISNIGSSVLIHKDNFPSIIDRILKIYEEKEDYDECAKIIKLKNKL